MEFTHQEQKIFNRIQNLIVESSQKIPLTSEQTANKIFRIFQSNGITSESRYTILSKLLQSSVLSRNVLTELAIRISEKTIPEVRTNEFLLFDDHLKDVPRIKKQWRNQSITLNNAKESIRITTQINHFP